MSFAPVCRALMLAVLEDRRLPARAKAGEGPVHDRSRIRRAPEADPADRMTPARHDGGAVIQARTTCSKGQLAAKRRDSRSLALIAGRARRGSMPRREGREKASVRRPQSRRAGADDLRQRTAFSEGTSAGRLFTAVPCPGSGDASAANTRPGWPRRRRGHRDAELAAEASLDPSRGASGNQRSIDAGSTRSRPPFCAVRPRRWLFAVRPRCPLRGPTSTPARRGSIPVPEDSPRISARGAPRSTGPSRRPHRRDSSRGTSRGGRLATGGGRPGGRACASS